MSLRKFPSDGKQPFDDARPKGILMMTRTDETTGQKHDIWIPYTRQAFVALKEGDLLAGMNFNSFQHNHVYALLEVTSFIVEHAAMAAERHGGVTAGSPTFRTAVARNTQKDLVDQESVVDEDTTQIHIEAVSLNQQLRTDASYHYVEQSRVPPMLGCEVHFVRSELVEAILNGDITPTGLSTIRVGTTLATKGREKKVEVLVNAEALMRTHFGIFGFTGAGKSNLTNALVRRMLRAQSKRPGPASHLESNNIVLVDLMDEYKTLLLDRILDDNVDASYVFRGEQGIPDAIVQFLSTHPNDASEETLALRRKAAEQWHRSFLFPRSLDHRREEFLSSIERVLEKRRFLIAEEGYKPVHVFWDEMQDTLDNENFLPATRQFINELRDNIFEPRAKYSLDERIYEQIRAEMDELKREPALAGFSDGAAGKRILQFERALHRAAHPKKSKFPEHARTTLLDLAKRLDDPEKPTLLLLTGHDPDALREFASSLVMMSTSGRRKRGRNGPATSFIFDEADEFLPASPSTDSQKRSRRVIEELARRGRKFGLGVGIATQRITYLETTSLSQLNTYFISKLPRQTDRTRIGEAFSLGEDLFQQTFTFDRGDWILVSHSATGLAGTPVPVHVPNSEKELLEGLGLPPDSPE